MTTPKRTPTQGVNPKDQLARAEHRVDMTLFPDTAVIAGAMAMVEGDCVYGGFNYRTIPVEAMTYVAAEERHMKAWRNGENIDPKSGLSHLWKALACIAILIDAEQCGTLVDNRPPQAPVGAMLEALKPLVSALRERHKDSGASRYTWRDQDPSVDHQQLVTDLAMQAQGRDRFGDPVRPRCTCPGSKAGHDKGCALSAS